MTIRTKLSIGCGVAAVLASSISEAVRYFYPGDAFGETGTLLSAVSVLMAGILTAALTFAAWNLFAAPRIRDVLQQIATMQPGTLSLQSLRQNDEFTRLSTALNELGHRTATRAHRSDEGAFALAESGRRLLTRITLASEHVASLTSLLQIAQQYRQGVPRAIQNLTLVEKDLRRLRTDFDDQLLQPLEERLLQGSSTGHTPRWADTDSGGSFQASELRVVGANADPHDS